MSSPILDQVGTAVGIESFIGHYMTGGDELAGRFVYVAKNGHDSNDGHSIFRPVQTIARALDLATTGTVIVCGPAPQSDPHPLDNVAQLPSQSAIVGIYGAATAVWIQCLNPGDPFAFATASFAAGLTVITDSGNITYQPLTSEDGALKSEVTTARQQLQLLIDQEVSDRAAAVAAEATARGAAITDLTTSIATETTARSAAIAAETAAREAAITAGALALAEEEAARQASDVALLTPDRPGELGGDAFFVSDLTGGEPTAAVAPVGARAVDAEGSVWRVPGSEVTAHRMLVPIEPGRVYAVRALYRRETDSADPSGDAVVTAIAWYGPSKNYLAADSTVATDANPTLADGLRTQAATVSTAAGQTVTAPAGARYARLYVETFGDSPVTDVIHLSWQDITDAGTYAPDLAATNARVTALEGIDVGTRVTALESAVSAPETARYLTKGSAQATTVGGTVDVVELLGEAAAGDTLRRTFVRSVGAPTGTDAFQDASAVWFGESPESALERRRTIPTTAAAAALRHPAAAKTVLISEFAPGDGMRAHWSRQPSEPSHGAKFRSVDRYLPDGTVSAGNGGWWAIDEEEIAPEMLGAKGDGLADDGPILVTAVAVGRDVGLTRGKRYLMTGSTLTPSDGQRIRGPGRLIKGDSGGNYDDTFIEIHGVADVEILDVEFEQTGDRDYCVTVMESERVRIAGCKSLGNETFCFVWRLSDTVTIENNTIVGGQFGIASGGDAAGNTDGLVRYLTIRNNFITGCTSEAIDINWDTQSCNILDNYCVANNTTSPDSEEIDVGGGACKYITIRGNVIDGGGNSATGILVKKNPTIPTEHVIVENNYIFNLVTGGAGRGIRVTNTEVARVTGNTIVGPVARGISIDTDVVDVEVSYNKIYNSESFGILVDVLVDKATLEGIKIVGNVIDGTVGDGINILEATGYEITDNTVRNGESRGIHIDPSCGPGLVAKNTINDIALTAGTYGIFVRAASTKVLDNTIADVGGTGIGIDAVANCEIRGNDVRNVSRFVAETYFGIQMGGLGCDNTRIIGNHVRDDQVAKTSLGLRVGEGDRCVIADNILHDVAATPLTGLSLLTASIVRDNITV